MSFINVEIKARSSNPEKIRKILEDNNARHIGLDNQIDTYFKIKDGRLKLREGNIENNLIYYNRPDREGPKQSEIILYKTRRDSGLKEILFKSMDISVIVDKKRDIYLIDNVKFHIDEVIGLGNFVEIEAIDSEGIRNSEELLEQCRFYMKLLKINEDELISCSYSDFLLQQQNP